MLLFKRFVGSSCICPPWTAAMQSIMQRMCTQARLPDLWSNLHWALLHSGWQQPHVQHDAAEYLAYARRFIIPNLLAGGW